MHRPESATQALTCLPVKASQIRTVSSSPPVTTNRPSRERSAACTAPRWPRRTRTTCPLFRSQIRTAPSSEAVTARVPSAVASAAQSGEPFATSVFRRRAAPTAWRSARVRPSAALRVPRRARDVAAAIGSRSTMFEERATFADETASSRCSAPLLVHGDERARADQQECGRHPADRPADPPLRLPLRALCKRGARVEEVALERVQGVLVATAPLDRLRQARTAT